MELMPTPIKPHRNYAKFIIVALVVTLITVWGLFVNWLNREAISKGILVAKKETLKIKRDKITEQILELDNRLGIATGQILK